MAIKFVLKQITSAASAEESPTPGNHLFDENLFTVGSDAANNLIIPEAAPEQMVIVREGDFLTLINRAEGTRLNGEKLLREAFRTLSNGDRITIGNYFISVIDDAVNALFEDADQAETSENENLIDINRQVLSPVPEETVQPEKIPEQSPASPRNFAEILDTMRTEEDSFYFIVKEENKEIKRIPLEQTEIPIGANSKGNIAFAIEQISTVYAVARKDWSGILLESQRRNCVYVNDEAVETTRRLRNDDRISFAAPTRCALVLHEPSSLVALESLLSARVASNGTRFGGLAANGAAAAENKPAAEIQNVSLLERHFFNHFSFFEIAAMVIGTLIGAVLFFMFFELMFS